MAHEQGRLVVVEGPDRGLVADVRDGLIVGRDRACDLCLGDKDVSREHFRLRWRRGGIEVEDLESSNGVKVNDRFVSNGPLTPGDRIRAGNTVLVFELPGFRRSLPISLFIGAGLAATVALFAYLSWRRAADGRGLRIERHRALAQGYEQSGNASEALAEYEILEREEPGRYRARLADLRDEAVFQERLAKAAQLAAAGAVEESQAVADSLRGARPDRAEVGVLLDNLGAGLARYLARSRAGDMVQRNEYDSAVALLDSLASGPDVNAMNAAVSRTLTAKGYWRLARGDRSAAEQAFNDALGRNPANSLARQGREDAKTASWVPPRVTAGGRQGKPPEERPKKPPAEEKRVVGDLTREREKAAEDIYAAGLKRLVDYGDTVGARRRFLEVIEFLGDYPGTRWCVEAGKQLDNIGR